MGYSIVINVFVEQYKRITSESVTIFNSKVSNGDEMYTEWVLYYPKYRKNLVSRVNNLSSDVRFLNWKEIGLWVNLVATLSRK